MTSVFLPTIFVFVTCLTLCTFHIVKGDEEPNIRENEVVSAESNEDFIDLSMYGESIYGSPVTRSSEPENSNQDYKQNPEETGAYLEGDILIPERNGIAGRSYRWPNGVVPYEIKGKFTAKELSMINYAMSEFHKKTCIRFRPRTYTDKDYISIVNGNTGCWSSIGRLGGRQEVNLQSNLCMRSYGTPIHELMHAIGFFHEQNRHERDSYVRVLTENIRPGMTHNFAKYSPKSSYAFGVPYDYASLLHYSPRSFSINGKPTLLALQNTVASRSMGQRYGFSGGDIAKINAMYRCSKNLI